MTKLDSKTEYKAEGQMKDPGTLTYVWGEASENKIRNPKMNSHHASKQK